MHRTTKRVLRAPLPTLTFAALVAALGPLAAPAFAQAPESGSESSVPETAGQPTAQEAPPQGIRWTSETEFSFVATGGNKPSNTLGMKAAVTGKSGPDGLKLEAGGIRGETTVTQRTATGSKDEYTLVEQRTSELTAESFFAKARYDRALQGSFLFAGSGWDRNTFAGVQNRLAFVLGAGRTWADSDSTRFKADLGATYTIQKDVEPRPDANEGFGGARVTIDAMKRLTETARYSTELILDQNLEDTEDVRSDWTHALTVALSESMALRTSLRLLFDNNPSLLRVPLVDPDGAQTGDRVQVPGARLDRVTTITLVIRL